MTMRGPEPEFPVSHCVPCGRDVLTHVHVDERGAEHRFCLHCDAEIDLAAVRWIGEPALEPLGYRLDGDEPLGCGRPGCGQGRCGAPMTTTESSRTKEILE
jgi:hypothetical protein